MASGVNSQPLGPDESAILAWLRERYAGGRPRTHSTTEIGRGVFGRSDGPMPGVLFDPAAWPRLNRALKRLMDLGLVDEGRLPQGDAGFRLTRAGGAVTRP